jgi:hypothetical protein
MAGVEPLIASSRRGEGRESEVTSIEHEMKSWKDRPLKTKVNVQIPSKSFPLLLQFVNHSLL